MSVASQEQMKKLKGRLLAYHARYPKGCPLMSTVWRNWEAEELVRRLAMDHTLPKTMYRQMNGTDYGEGMKILLNSGAVVMVPDIPSGSEVPKLTVKGWQIAMGGIWSMRTLDCPLRVPVKGPDDCIAHLNLWAYLRIWSRYTHANWSERTIGSESGAFTVLAEASESGPARMRDRGPGTPFFDEVIDDGHYLFGAGRKAMETAMDRRLLDLGAEIVPVGEWPANCAGAGYRKDRRPYLGGGDLWDRHEEFGVPKEVCKMIWQWERGEDA